MKDVAGNSDTFSKALNIMNYITEMTDYDGNSPLPPSTSDIIIHYSFGKKKEHPINCANKAILLSDALISLGIIATPVWLTNRNINIRSKKYLVCYNHVIVHVFLAESQKWVALDPSFNTYFVDINKVALNIIEIINCYKRGVFSYSIINGSNHFTSYGRPCLEHCLLNVSFFKSNNPSHEFKWENQYHLLPKQYIKDVEILLKNQSLSELDVNLLKEIVLCNKVNTNQFLEIPKFF